MQSVRRPTLVSQIEELLDANRTLSLVPGRSRRHIPQLASYQHQYLPTKRCWSLTDERTICIQLNGQWKGHLKNPSIAEKMRLIDTLNSVGFSIREIGLPMRLAECVDALSRCYCFIGVDSGIMHVANSVRCPRILVRNRMFRVDTVYSGKGVVVASNLASAVNLIC